MRRITLTVMAGIAAWCVGVGLPSCGEDSSGARRVSLHTRVELMPEAKGPFTTLLGWEVELEVAMIGTGSLYYYDGAPPLAQLDAPGRPPSDAGSAARRWLGVRVAHAHPGHYESGAALGQMLIPSSVDLLAGSTALGEGEGVTGTYRSGSFSFATGAGPLSTQLNAGVASLQGTARKSGESARHFRARASLADVEHTAAQGIVSGCAFDPATEVTGDGTIVVRVNPSVWFQLVDFSELDPSDAIQELPEGSQPKIALAQGLAELSAYEFSFIPD